MKTATEPRLPDLLTPAHQRIQPCRVGTVLCPPGFSNIAIDYLVRRFWEHYIRDKNDFARPVD
ncbi:MAG: hypothetical protein Q8K74_01800 [Candidatus Nitrotoga sp.]|nr:hypothetical protein [Candidatus Nitrotoga sp.]